MGCRPPTPRSNPSPCREPDAAPRFTTIVCKVYHTHDKNHKSPTQHTCLSVKHAQIKSGKKRKRLGSSSSSREY
uniref:Uncharacterized protein n=1 Tax=Nelumbo nucifera TaxID=4432 RepID=A0A822Z5S7_NELNU|nr:TPA_asm: hypothetical protein HUJ06_008987 [Nelumbo nucifera]